MLYYRSPQELHSPSKRGVRVMAFDLDGTLISVKSNQDPNIYSPPKDRYDWKWWDSCVPAKLQNLHNEGYKIVIFTNQSGINGDPKDFQKGVEIKAKIDMIIHELKIPVHAFIATAEDIYRKPSTEMWEFMVRNCIGNMKLDTEGSLFVGDAAGRVAGWKKGLNADFSCCDRKFAYNIGITFLTPEEFFLNEKPAEFEWEEKDFLGPSLVTEDMIGNEISQLASDMPEEVVVVV